MAESKKVKIPQLKLTCVKDAPILAVKWLWPNRIPLGMLTLLAGKPGTGKSTLAHNIIARVSNGSPWPDMRDRPTPKGDCVLISDEDSLSHTVKPRLLKMNADMSNVHVGTEVGIDLKCERFSLIDHLHVLENLLVQNPQIKLVVLDTIEPFMGSVNTHRNSEVRRTLDPLSALADRTGVAIIGITHLNKASKENRSAIDRVMGSVGYTGGARVVWLLAKDEDDKDLVKMVLVKSNVFGDPGGIAYKMFQVGMLDVHGEETWTTIIKFQEGIIRDDADALSQRDSQLKAQVDHCGDWLRKLLGGAPMLQAAILQAGKKEKYAQATIYRRRNKLGIVTFTTKAEGIKKSLVWWRLPNK